MSARVRPKRHNAYVLAVTGFVTRHERLLVAAALIVLIALIIVVGHVPQAQYSLECKRRAWVAQDLAAGLSRGREGLVGSLDMPPLPTAIMAALGIVPFVSFPAAGCIVSGLAPGLLAVYVNALWRRRGISRALRYPSMACLLLLPPVALSIQLGQSTMLFVALVLCGLGFLLTWLWGRSLRDLAYSALLLGLATAVRSQAIFVVLVALLVVAIAAACTHWKLSAIEGTCITFFTPTGYVILLWLAGNWLILGNPVFFLKALPGAVSAGMLDFGGFLSRNCDWRTVAAIAPLVVSVPLVSCVARGPAARHAAAGGGLLLTVLIVLAADVSPPIRTGDAAIPHVVNALTERHPAAMFIVTGYEGYEFAEAAPEDPDSQWLHLMHLHPSKLAEVLHDLKGRDVYVVLKEDGSLESWQDLGWQWKGVHSRIPEGFMFADRVDSWLVFECLMGP